MWLHVFEYVYCFASMLFTNVNKRRVSKCLMRLVLFHSNLETMYEKLKTDTVSLELTNCNEEIAKLRIEIVSLKVSLCQNAKKTPIIFKLICFSRQF